MKKTTKAQLIALRGNKCEDCGIGPEWNGKSFTFDEHHSKKSKKKMSISTKKEYSERKCLSKAA